MITFRRHYLDVFLSGELFAGDVLDVGGEKSNRRGCFQVPKERVRSWLIANIDPKTSPDVVCGAEKLPFEAGKFDFVLLSEVVEHLKDPAEALSEAARVLRSGGSLVMTIPFLYSVHGDPDDYQRWTPSRIRLELAKAGFQSSSIRPMGGLLAVVLDLFEMHCHFEMVDRGRLRLRTKILRGIVRKVFGRLFLSWDSRYPFSDAMTTGYYVKAVRP